MIADYIPPSQCVACVPIERRFNYGRTQLAHEPECPNHPGRTSKP